MSHAATNWAIQQRGLKPATKIVLWQLADCHNGHTGQCNPRQSVLAERCEMSRSTINVHLDKLEAMGLIRRVVSVSPETGKQRPTAYVLAFDDTAKPVSGNKTRPQDVVPPCPETGHGTVSGKDESPCPDFGHSRVRNSDTKNLGKEPGKEPCVSQNDTHTQFSKFWDAHPRPKDRQASERLFSQAIANGASPEAIIHGAKAYADEQAGNAKQYIAGSDAWLKSKRWTEFDAPKSTDPNAKKAILEKMLKSPVQSVREAALKMQDASA